MTPSDLMARLNAQEDGYVERKSQGIKPQDIRKAVTAFANSLPDGQHGIIYIGIGDKGSIEGCDNPDAVQKRVREAADECYPPVATQCVALKVEDKDVVAIVVSPSSDKPHFAGPAYVRQGSESVKASKRLYDEMVDTRHSTVAAIARLKDLTITVYGLGHRLGQPVRVAADYREAAECKVMACDAHMVTLQRLNDSWIFYEAVNRIELSIDGKMKRPALIVKGL
ncbi:putative transcriptional regulator with HTH domain [Caulobacter sp. AP07]|uniref:AlbA family DNA-binding domain-containing protein n=1 Tax=Caulobacter sp. AP07 TaxID=1144304 RepID=UPI0002720189|nr:ATP-binding protein [Caulobacter sp. AP07]EJL32207.1 putative transcriptional regulator with HTH domain [Caulobacter sp. AP07]